VGATGLRQPRPVSAGHSRQWRLWQAGAQLRRKSPAWYRRVSARA